MSPLPPDLLRLTPAARDGVWLIVHFRIKPDRVADAEALFRQHVEDGRADAGNLMFACLRDPEDPARFVTLEAWTDQQAIDEHDAQPHHDRFITQLQEIQAEEKHVEFLDFFHATARD